jgi:bis(5'-nucleosyl)-tetraphosphatase (symmetrical)
MAVWAIGDIQGCYDSFMELLSRIDFDPKRDKLWLVGDLVNRGDKSLEVLEYLYDIKDNLEIVLGNHDITLISAYYGIKKSDPTIEPILQSKRAKELIDWLRGEKFLHIDFNLGYCMSHAGISPEFDLGMAMEYARRIEQKLQAPDANVWLKAMFEDASERFDRGADVLDLDRYILATFTRMRYCYNDKRLDFKQKGTPTQKKVDKKGMKPWFECQNRKDVDLKILFGHWSTLGLYKDENVICIDSGCLWGGAMSAIRLDSGREEIVQVKCKGCQDPTKF